MIGINSNLTAAFKALRKDGYFARKNWQCCQSCGWAAIPNNKADKAVFYHAQDNDNLKESGEVMLAWSGDGDHIVSRLNEYGVHTDWNGSDGQRILCSDAGLSKSLN